MCDLVVRRSVVVDNLNGYYRRSIVLNSALKHAGTSSNEIFRVLLAGVVRHRVLVTIKGTQDIIITKSLRVPGSYLELVLVPSMFYTNYWVVVHCSPATKSKLLSVGYDVRTANAIVNLSTYARNVFYNNNVGGARYGNSN